MSSPASSAQSEKPTRSVNTIASRSSPSLPAAALGDRLPDLQRREPRLLEDPRAAPGELAEAPRHHLARLRAGGRERVAVAAVAGEQLARDPHRAASASGRRALAAPLSSSLVVGHRDSGGITPPRRDRYIARCNDGGAGPDRPPAPPIESPRRDHRPRSLLRPLPRARDDDDVRQPGLDRAADARRTSPTTSATCSGSRRRSWSGWPTATRRRAAARRWSTCTPRPASATRWGRSSTPRRTTRRS